MRKLPYLAFLLVLAGCEGQDVTMLTFDESLRDTHRSTKDGSPEVKQGYRNAIEALLKDQGIDPKKVSIRVSPDDDNTVILNTRPRVAESDDFESFHNALSSIVESRSALPLTLTFNFDKENLGSEGPEIQERLADLPDEVEAVLVPDGVILSHTYGIGTVLAAALSGSDRASSTAYCNITASVEPSLPFIFIKYLVDDDGENGRYAVGWNSVDVDVTLTFNDETLQDLLDKGEMIVAPTLNSRDWSNALTRGRLGKVDLQLGSLGVLQHDYAGRADYLSHSSMRSRCRTRAIELGSPFSFYMGNTMDRLASFTPLTSEN